VGTILRVLFSIPRKRNPRVLEELGGRCLLKWTGFALMV
jgi:hypothetical protein